MSIENQRKITALRRIKLITESVIEQHAIDRIMVDIEKIDLPINRKYRFVKDMYSAEEIIPMSPPPL